MLHGTTLKALSFQIFDLACFDQDFGISWSNNWPEKSTSQPSRDQQYGWCLWGAQQKTGYTKRSQPETKQKDNLQTGIFFWFSGDWVMSFPGVMLPDYLKQRQRKEHELSATTPFKDNSTKVPRKCQKCSFVCKYWSLFISEITVTTGPQDGNALLFVGHLL